MSNFPIIPGLQILQRFIFDNHPFHKVFKTLLLVKQQTEDSSHYLLLPVRLWKPIQE